MRNSAVGLHWNTHTHILYWPLYSAGKFISCVIPCPVQWFFHFGEEILIAWNHIGWVGGYSRISHWQQRKRSMTIGCDSLHCHEEWWGSLPPVSFSPEFMHYDLSAKAKEPLWRTQCNTIDELIRAIELSIWNSNKDGCTDDVQCLPNVWQMVINKGRRRGDYIEGI